MNVEKHWGLIKLEPTAHLTITFGNIVALVLAASFGAWAWIVKTSASKLLSSVDQATKEVGQLRRDLTNEMASLRAEIVRHGERLTRVETKQKYQYVPHSINGDADDDEG